MTPLTVLLSTAFIFPSYMGDNILAIVSVMGVIQAVAIYILYEQTVANTHSTA